MTKTYVDKNTASITTKARIVQRYTQRLMLSLGISVKLQYTAYHQDEQPDTHTSRGHGLLLSPYWDEQTFHMVPRVIKPIF